jgi:hypothetical protein
MNDSKFEWFIFESCFARNRLLSLITIFIVKRFHLWMKMIAYDSNEELVTKYHLIIETDKIKCDTLFEAYSHKSQY